MRAVTAPEPMPAPQPASSAASAAGPAGHVVWRTELRFERVVFFSDAVMAIAITLLLVDIRPPESDEAGYEAALLAMLQRPEPFIAVAIGFLVLGSYWISHRAVFSLFERSAPSVLWANLVFLFGVALQPFFTMALAAQTPNRVSVAAYAGCQVFTGLALWLVWLLALRAGVLATTATRRRRRFMHLQLLRSPAVFALSIPVAILVGPLAGMLVWPLQVVILLIAARTFPEQPRDPDVLPVAG